MQSVVKFPLAGLLLTLVVLGLPLARADDGTPKDGTKLVQSKFVKTWADEEAAEIVILEKLTQRVTLVKKTTLAGFAEWLESELQVATTINAEALADEQIGSDDPVAVKAKNQRLEVVLDQTLNPLGVGWRITDGTMEITSLARIDERWETRIYAAQALLDSGFEIQQLIQVIQECTSGPWQSREGDGGTITKMPKGRLLIRHTPRIQLEIARLLSRLEALDRKEQQPAVGQKRRIENAAGQRPIQRTRKSGSKSADDQRRTKK